MTTTVPTVIKTININKWELGDGNYLVSYTASWCGPCQRIKPHLLEMMASNKHVSHKEIPKDTRPTHVTFIPFFDLTTSSGDIVRSIQTSKEELLRDFLERKELELDDNF